MRQEKLINEQVAGLPATQRGLQRRKPGVEYQLRVVPGSGGRLELVERVPERLRMLQWMHLALINGF